jgi:hypothetical protein
MIMIIFRVYYGRLLNNNFAIYDGCNVNDPGYEMEETRCIPRGFEQKG